MGAVVIDTASCSWKKLKSTNFTSTAFTALQGRTTVPSGDGVVKRLGGGSGGFVKSALLLKFFGTSANNQNFNARVYGYDFCPDTNSWENVLLAQFAVTLGNLAGLAGTAILAADFEADTIAVTYGSGVDVTVNSNAADVRGAYARLDGLGSAYLYFDFDRNSSAASCNLIYKEL